MQFNDIHEVIHNIRQTWKFHVKIKFEKLSNLFHDPKSIETTIMCLLLFRLKFLNVNNILQNSVDKPPRRQAHPGTNIYRCQQICPLQISPPFPPQISPFRDTKYKKAKLKRTAFLFYVNMKVFFFTFLLSNCFFHFMF